MKTPSKGSPDKFGPLWYERHRIRAAQCKAGHAKKKAAAANPAEWFTAEAARVSRLALAVAKVQRRTKKAPEAKAAALASAFRELAALAKAAHDAAIAYALASEADAARLAADHSSPRPSPRKPTA